MARLTCAHQHTDECVQGSDRFAHLKGIDLKTCSRHEEHDEAECWTEMWPAGKTRVVIEESVSTPARRLGRIIVNHSMRCLERPVDRLCDDFSVLFSLISIEEDIEGGDWPKLVSCDSCDRQLPEWMVQHGEMSGAEADCCDFCLSELAREFGVPHEWGSYG